MTSWVATGYPKASAQLPPFVAMGPAFAATDGNGSAFFASFHMPPTAARDLATQLLAAADLADGITPAAEVAA